METARQDHIIITEPLKHNALILKYNVYVTKNTTTVLLVCYGSLSLKVLVATIDAQWEEMGDVGSARYEPALLPPCPTIRVLSYSS